MHIFLKLQLWIISKLKQVIKYVIIYFDEYRFYNGFSSTKLRHFYVRQVRDIYRSTEILYLYIIFE